MARVDSLDPATSAERSDVRLRAAPLLLALIALALFLPGFFGLQPMDRDEPRFAQATRQMLQTGDFVSIRFQDEARNKKPVGIYWAQAAVVRAAEALGMSHARQTIWLYRIPSLLGALGCVLLTYWAGLAFGSRRMAFVAGLLLASSVVMGVEARLAKTDAVNAAMVVAAMGALARVWQARLAGKFGVSSSRTGWLEPAVFWTAMAAGVLVKGPVAPMVVGLAILVLCIFERSGRWLLALRPLAGIAWMLLLVSPWFILIMLRTHGAFLTDSVGGDMLQKVAGGVELHGAPPGAYLVTFLGTGWPLAPFALLAAPFAFSERRRDPAVLFLLAWLVPSWLVFEVVPTKLPHYVLPLFPAIALLVGRAAEQGGLDREAPWRRAVASLVPVFAVLLLLGAAVACLWQRAPAGLVFLVMVPVAAWLVLRWLRLGAASPEVYAMHAAALALTVYVAIYGGLLTGPFMKTFSLSPRLAGAIQSARAMTTCSSLQVASVGYSEPSFIFLTTADTMLTGPDEAADFLSDGSCRVAVVERQFEPAFRAAIAGRSDIRATGRVRGFNLNKNRELDFGLYLRGGGP